jgi:hypothetical protein
LVRQSTQVAKCGPSWARTGTRRSMPRDVLCRRRQVGTSTALTSRAITAGHPTRHPRTPPAAGPGPGAGGLYTADPRIPDDCLPGNHGHRSPGHRSPPA